MDHKKLPPLVVIEKVEIGGVYHQQANSEMLGAILHKMERTYQAVIRDTAVEEALLEENAELEKKLADILNGENLPPELQKKLNSALAGVKSVKDKLKAKIDETKQSQ